ncbi:MAG: biopolymer transporter ExbD [Reinekea sp.]|jgi:biopolymer transport protein ExbD
MRFRRSRQQDEVSVNITPLIDVVFLLLIFFMVTTTFTRETQLKIDLPDSQSQVQADDSKPIEILIDRNGSYAINGEVMIRNDIESLKRGLGELNLSTETPVVLTGDSEANLQFFVRAMDAVGQLGFYKISITTQQPESQ